MAPSMNIVLPEQVTVEMERLVEFYDRYRREGVVPEVLSAWLHHRFVQIHPFHDGNGRVARALASLVFVRQGWFPLVVHRDQRIDYIDALETADRGDLVPLVGLFAAAQRKASSTPSGSRGKFGVRVSISIRWWLPSVTTFESGTRTWPETWSKPRNTQSRFRQNQETSSPSYPSYSARRSEVPTLGTYSVTMARRAT